MISIYLSIYPSVCLSVYFSVCLSIDLSVCLSIYLSIYPSLYLSIRLAIYISVSLSIYQSVYMSVDLFYLSIYLPIYWFIHLSTFPYIMLQLNDIIVIHWNVIQQWLIGNYVAENASESERKNLLSELELMKHLKPHPYVIKLLGCVTKSGKYWNVYY